MRHQSIFQARRDLVYRRYAVGIHVDSIVGGVPSNPKVIDGWLRTNLGEATDEQLRRLVIQTMEERGIDVNAAAEVVASESKLNGFKRNPPADRPGHDPDHPVGELFSEGRHIKAMLKENSNIAWPKATWGPSRKGTRGWWSEHIFCEEDRVYHGGRMEADDKQQRFVSTFRGTSFVYEEIQHDLDLSFHLLVDGDEHIGAEKWAEMWLRAEQNGLGAVRSQSFGRFVVTRFDEVGFDGDR